MDSNLDWDDFHFLNSSFVDVIASSSSKWIEASLVRISHHGRDRTKDVRRTVRAIEGLVIQYAVPFPLTYIFGPKAIQAAKARPSSSRHCCGKACRPAITPGLWSS